MRKESAVCGQARLRAQPIRETIVQNRLSLARARRNALDIAKEQGDCAREPEDAPDPSCHAHHRGARMSSTLDVYTHAYGLRERPFSIVPDPSFIYWSPGHVRAFAILEYGLITRAQITLITGAVGAGKTTLLHQLLASVGPETRIGLVSNAQGDRGELLRWVLLAFDQTAETSDTYVDLFARFQSFLIAEYARGRRVVLIFDEAQNLDKVALEELRMFTNINSGKDELLQIILVGQPELREMVLQPDLVQFAQRVSAGFHLEALDEASVHGYIHHRLEVSGAQKQIFSDAACTAIYEATQGVPRLVNQLCDLSMVYGFSAQRLEIDAEIVAQVLADGVFYPAQRRLIDQGAR